MIMSSIQSSSINKPSLSSGGDSIISKTTTPPDSAASAETASSTSESVGGKHDFLEKMAQAEKDHKGETPLDQDAALADLEQKMEHVEDAQQSLTLDGEQKSDADNIVVSQVLDPTTLSPDKVSGSADATTQPSIAVTEKIPTTPLMRAPKTLSDQPAQVMRESLMVKPEIENKSELTAELPIVNKLITNKPELNVSGDKIGSVKSSPTDLLSSTIDLIAKSVANANTSNAHNVAALNNTNATQQSMTFTSSIYANPMLAKKDFQQQIFSMVSDKLDLQINSKSPSATIRLDPPELGKIELKVKLDGDKITVHLTANNPHTREAIQTTIDRLRTDMSLDMNAQVTVSLSLPDQQQQNSEATLGGDTDSILSNSVGEVSNLKQDNEESINNAFLAKV
ncbi:hypothetical protein HC725_09025 [Vibrio sp. S17_S38]|uniref:flagellar hook-length control protein FliK n=1 Tax=Vibrio sp. S17_S38 TaxID=2720229 RepID=UPI001680B569|nr:flagellar hook-length control protein FliK [Vibrio sp. S17_S38]MBD1573416.1 hypothetical protein [Vibrio sp. S17_S38]